ncbi:MAG TPA: S41 family peptidase [Gemmatimonadales bacterium]|nr:S41 family peptidase [Gemmatimonadales bacterium]
MQHEGKEQAMRARWGMITLVAGLVTVAFFTGGWLKRPEPAANGNVYQQARLFEDVLAAIRTQYVDSISETDLYFRATTGTVDHLRDPYSMLLVGDAYRRFTDKLNGTTDGLGLQLDLRDGKLAVAGTTPGSPAERDGLLPGDLLLTIDGTATKGWNIERAEAALRPEPGDTVTVTVRRAGIADVITHRLVSGRVHVRATSPGILLDQGVGVVALRVVSDSAARELAETVDSLRALGMTSLVVDLRSNPGGMLNQGIALAGLFLDRGQTIGTLRGRTERQTTVYTAEGPERWPDLRVALLVNGGTASSAEIFAGALQDHDRAVVVGAPTLGKGAVQSTIPLGRDVAVKLTTARWSTPSGRGIQRPLQGLPFNPDTTEIFRTDSGRPVPNAHGILPDVRLPRTQPAPAELALADALGGDLSAYRDVLEAYATELATQGQVTSDTLAVTPAMRREVAQRLHAAGLRVPARVYEAAAAVVDRDLGQELTRAAFGAAAADRRRLREDAQVHAAAALLQARQVAEGLWTLPVWR